MILSCSTVCDKKNLNYLNCLKCERILVSKLYRESRWVKVTGWDHLDPLLHSLLPLLS